jgi:hypothetical protein
MTEDDKCAPDGQICDRCQGTHNPQPGVTFVTSRKWSTDDDVETDEG